MAKPVVTGCKHGTSSRFSVTWPFFYTQKTGKWLSFKNGVACCARENESIFAGKCGRVWRSQCWRIWRFNNHIIWRRSRITFSIGKFPYLLFCPCAVGFCPALGFHSLVTKNKTAQSYPHPAHSHECFVNILGQDDACLTCQIIHLISPFYALRVHSSGPHPLLGESSTFRRGVRVSSSETGWLFQPHLPLLAFGVDELGIFAKRCFDCRNMTSVWPKNYHFFTSAERGNYKTSWKTFAWVTCPVHFLTNPELLCVCVTVCVFYCFALRFVFRGDSSVLLTQLTICIRGFVSFAVGWSGSRKFMIVSPIYLRTRWSSAVFWGVSK